MYYKFAFGIGDKSEYNLNDSEYNPADTSEYNTGDKSGYNAVIVGLVNSAVSYLEKAREELPTAPVSRPFNPSQGSVADSSQAIPLLRSSRLLVRACELYVGRFWRLKAV